MTSQAGVTVILHPSFLLVPPSDGLDLVIVAHERDDVPGVVTDESRGDLGLVRVDAVLRG